MRKPLNIEYRIVRHGERGAGIRPYTQTITVTVKSGDPGGEPEEFAEELQSFLADWFDGAEVELLPSEAK